MIKKIQKTFFCLLFLVMAYTVNAQSFTQDDIVYSATSSSTVNVISGSCATGNLVIPSQVTNSGITYNVVKINFNAFKGCATLTSVIIPSSVTLIGVSAFEDCTTLTSITIPNSVVEISSSAFKGCTALTSVTIPSSVTTLNPFVFMNCTAITSIVIPNSVTEIDSSAFNGCTALTSVTIPNSVTDLGPAIFYGCTALTSITIPDSVTSSIGRFSFQDCSALTTVNIGNSVPIIGNSAFENCSSLTSVTIPNSVTSINTRAFANCGGLTEFNVDLVTPLNIDSNVFDNITLSNVNLNVPEASIDLYKAADVWKDFSKVEIYYPKTYITTTCLPYITPGGYEITSSEPYLEIIAGEGIIYIVTFNLTAKTQDILKDESVIKITEIAKTAETNFTSYLEFNKSDKRYVNVDVLQDDLAASNRSVFMWIKAPTNVKSTSQMLFAINSSAGGNVCNLQLSTSEKLQLYDGSTTRSTSVTLNDGLWHHVGYTYNDATNQAIVYSDGVEVLTFTNDQDAKLSDVFSLGQEYDGGLSKGNFYDGLMTEVSIWNEVLDLADITPLMEAKIKSTHPKYANLIGYYGYSDCDTPTTTLKDYTNAAANSGILSHETITKKDDFDEIPNFNSIDWYTVSWFKDDFEIASTKIADFVPFSGTNTYRLEIKRDFISISDLWDISNAANYSSWIGVTNSDWTTTTNWVGNALPTATNDVVIHNTTNKPVISANTGAVGKRITISTSSSLTIEGGGTLINSGAVTTNGDFIYKVKINDTKWHLISSPVQGESYDDAWNTANNIETKLPNEAISYYINTSDADGDWVYYQDKGEAVNFISAKGYSLKRTVAGDYVFTGKFPNISNIAIPLNANDIGGANENRWNLIGNPVPSYIDIETFLTTNSAILLNTHQAVYVWNANFGSTGKYEPVTTGKIHPGQAFFISANQAAYSNASFTSTMQSHQTSIPFYKTSNTKITLILSDGTKTKSTEINYLADKTTGLDPRFDIGTFTGQASSFNLYTHLVSNSEGVNFARQALPNNNYENLIVPIGVKATSNKEIIFSAEALNLPSNIKVFLEDKQTKTFTRLDEAGSNYRVKLKEDLNDIGRFFLHTSNNPPLNVENILLHNVSIFKTSASTLRIVGLQNDNASVKIFNVLGKQVVNTSFTSKAVKNITLPKLAKGVYVVKLQTEKGTLSKKIILE